MCYTIFMSKRKCTVESIDYDVDFPMTVSATVRCPIELRKLNLNENTRSSLIELILEHGDEQNHSSNVKADMTDWFMHTRYKEFKELSIFTEALSKKISKDNIDVMTFDCWGAVYRKGEETIKHTHWGNLWSWCYYLKVPSDSPPFRFEDIGEGKTASFDIYPQEDDLLMFPSWISHSVPVSQSDEERIMVAGNIQLNNKPKSQDIDYDSIMQTMVEKYI